mgnify:CR=1 FL=1
MIVEFCLNVGGLEALRVAVMSKQKEKVGDDLSMEHLVGQLSGNALNVGSIGKDT